jgi:hypothetical protein
VLLLPCFLISLLPYIYYVLVTFELYFSGLLGYSKCTAHYRGSLLLSGKLTPA